jgi:glycosyltransferase involved in cell wall biosynthesis
MTVIESLYACRPMLYVDPNLREGLDQGGLLCEAPTAGAMAAKLIELARNPELVVAASKRARIAYEIFTPEHFIVAIEAVYRQTMLSKQG